MHIRTCLALHIIAVAVCPACAVLQLAKFRRQLHIDPFDDGPRIVDSRNSRPWSTRPRPLVKTPADLIATDDPLAALQVDRQAPNVKTFDWKPFDWSSPPTNFVTAKKTWLEDHGDELSLEAPEKPGDDNTSSLEAPEEPGDDNTSSLEAPEKPGRGFAVPKNRESKLFATEGTYLHSRKVSWWYDSQVNPANSSIFTEAEFVPQVQINHVAFLDDEKTLKNAMFDTRTKYIMGFNEPNIRDQDTDVTPAVACGLFQEVFSFAEAHNLSVVSPSVDDCNKEAERCQWEAGEWLDEFFNFPACSLEKFHAIGVHRYGAPESIFRTVEKLNQKYKKPIWLTEFGPSECESSMQTARSLELMFKFWKKPTTVLERYAWGTRCSLFEQNSSLTFAGEAYFNGKERWEIDTFYASEKANLASA